MFVVRVSGLFEPRDPGDKAVLDDARLGRAVTRDTDTRRFVYGFGLVSPDAYGEIAAATRPLPLRYSWRYDVDATGFDASDFDSLEADVRALNARFGETTFGQPSGRAVCSLSPWRSWLCWQGLPQTGAGTRSIFCDHEAVRSGRCSARPP